MKLSISVPDDEWDLLVNRLLTESPSEIVQYLMGYYITNALRLERRVEWVMIDD